MSWELYGIVQGMDITMQELHSLVVAHVRQRVVYISPPPLFALYK